MNIYLKSLLLFIVLTLFLFYIIYNIDPHIVDGFDSKPNIYKTLGFSVVLSVIFTSLVAYISIKLKNKRNNK